MNNKLISTFLLLIFPILAVADRTVITVNQSSQPIWVGAEGKLVDPANPFDPTPVNPNNGGWYLAPNGGTHTVTVPNGWEGRFWGRTNCQFDEFGNGSCQTGNCANGLYCNGMWGSNATLAEMKFNGWMDLDFYDVSLIDGFNVPMQIIPVPGTYTPNGDYYYAGTAGCTTDVNYFAPPELAITDPFGEVIAWMATCTKWNIDKYCCYDNDPATCHPNEYSIVLKEACPDAYSYVTDHETSTFASSSGTVYQVVFPEPVIPDNGGKATIYKHCNFDGDSFSLAEGEYTLPQLQTLGVLDNDISSLQVENGYQIELFDNDNFTGDKLILTSESSCLVGAGWNDRASSIRVSQVSCTPSTLTPYLAINNGEWLAVNNATLTVGNKIVLAPHPIAENGWQWTGPNGFAATTREITLNNIQLHQEGTYTATFTNEQGCSRSISFDINVSQTSFLQKFQAEAFDLSSGVQIENGVNAENGQNVGYIQTNGWMVYSNVTFPSSGQYIVNFRVASAPGNGTLTLDLNAGSIFLTTLDIPATGGWYNWATFSKTVTINAGTYNVGIFANTPGWNIDSFTIRQQ